jgi:Uma2 family endonuclease
MEIVGLSLRKFHPGGNAIMIVPRPSPYLYDLSHIYPETDGLPMAEGTEQYRWIVTIKGGLDIQYRDDPNVFIAGDLFWYPLEGQPGIRVAPDVMVALGRPRGGRRSYLQWMEDNVPPQVVFEILSPGNRRQEMADKFAFFERHGVEEYYLYDPEDKQLEGWQRTGTLLTPIPHMEGWVSPRLGIRFDMSGPELRIFSREDRQFVDVPELDAQREQAEQRAEQERQEKEQARQQANRQRQRAERERQKAERERQEKERARQQAERERQEKEQARQQAERERQEKEQARQQEAEAAARAERLAAQLRALGIEPER